MAHDIHSISTSRFSPKVKKIITLVSVPILLLGLGVLGRRATRSSVTTITPAWGADSVGTEPSSTIDAATPLALQAQGEAHDSGSVSIQDASRNAIETLPDGAVIVDINLANEDELRKLPGVGAKRAHGIVELRTRLGGRFRSIDDLARIKRFGRKRLRELRPFLRASQPEAIKPTK